MCSKGSDSDVVDLLLNVLPVFVGALCLSFFC